MHLLAPLISAVLVTVIPAVPVSEVGPKVSVNLAQRFPDLALPELDDGPEGVEWLGLEPINGFPDFPAAIVEPIGPDVAPAIPTYQ
ncbi:unnamed protein product, partial [Mesorhabditis spiculigera]